MVDGQRMGYSMSKTPDGIDWKDIHRWQVWPSVSGRTTLNSMALRDPYLHIGHDLLEPLRSNISQLYSHCNGR
uniref:Uncharacterized protein n=1 Tax=Magnetococcus massalia (strain MO-1) TaxID=451514 RepID=A0A1S7LI97_MAGMO|nr:protein of unknown function [Candidatus Magnetococcus massalia]